MHFRSDFAEEVGRRADYRCEVFGCPANLRRENPADVARHIAHSATGFHLSDGPDSYLAISPPPKLKRKKRRLPGSMFAISIWGFKDDAFCICPDCHQAIHNEALAQTKIKFPNHKGRNAMWSILEWVTLKKIFGWK